MSKLPSQIHSLSPNYTHTPSYFQGKASLTEERGYRLHVTCAPQAHVFEHFPIAGGGIRRCGAFTKGGLGARHKSLGLGLGDSSLGNSNTVLYSLISYSESKQAPVPWTKLLCHIAPSVTGCPLSYQRTKHTSPLGCFCGAARTQHRKPHAFCLPSPRPPSCGAILP